MADTFKKLDQRQLTSGGTSPTAATLLYTAPASTQTIIKQIHVANTDTSACNITFYNPSYGQAASASNVILPAISIDAGGFAEFDGTITLAADEMFYALASNANRLTVTIYGLEIA